MPDISSIGQGSVGPLDRTAAREAPSAEGAAAPAEAARPHAGPEDRVELSDHARYLNRLRDLPPVRTDRIDEVRQAIQDGTYDTDEKLTTAVERLIQDLGM